MARSAWQLWGSSFMTSHIPMWPHASTQQHVSPSAHSIHRTLAWLHLITRPSYVIKPPYFSHPHQTAWHIPHQQQWVKEMGGMTTALWPSLRTSGAEAGLVFGWISWNFPYWEPHPEVHWVNNGGGLTTWWPTQENMLAGLRLPTSLFYQLLYLSGILSQASG